MENEVESLIGPTDIYIYPNGNDVADWHPYTEENYRYQYLASKGFRYFCNVDAASLHGSRRDLIICEWPEETWMVTACTKI